MPSDSPYNSWRQGACHRPLAFALFERVRVPIAWERAQSDHLQEEAPSAVSGQANGMYRLSVLGASGNAHAKNWRLGLKGGEESFNVFQRCPGWVKELDFVLGMVNQGETL